MGAVSDGSESFGERIGKTEAHRIAEDGTENIFENGLAGKE